MVPVEASEMFLRENTFQIKEELLSLPDKFVFPPSHPLARRSAIPKHLTTAIEDTDGHGPERGDVHVPLWCGCSTLLVHAFVAAMAMARLVTLLIQAAIAHTHPARLGRAADHESEVPNIMCI